MTAVQTPLPNRNPEQQPSVDVEPIDVLRGQLIDLGVFTDQLPGDEVLALTNAHEKTAKLAVENGVDADAAVDLVMEIDDPIFDLVINEEMNSRDLDGMSDDELTAMYDELHSQMRQTVFDRVAGDQDQNDRGARIKGIFGGVKSLAKRVSLTAKQTRKKYVHYQNTKKILRDADENDTDAYQLALDNKNEAKKEYRGTRVKAFGGFALLGAGLDAVLVTKGIDSSTVVSGIGLGLIAPAAAVKYEKRKLGDVVGDASLQAQIAGQNFLGRLRGGYTAKDQINYKKLEAKDPEAHTEMMELETKIDETEAALSEYIESDDFEDGSPEHQALLTEVENAFDSYEPRFNELLDEYGKKRLTKKGKLAIGAFALAGVGAYTVYKYGVPFTSKGSNTDVATPSGSGRGATPDVSVPVDVTPDVTPDAVPDVSVPVDVTPDVTPDATAQEYIDFYNTFNPDEKEAFGDFIDGIDQITTAHPDASQAQIDELVTNTIRLAADKQEFVSGGANFWDKFTLAQEYDEQFRRFIELSEQAAA